MAVPTSPSDRQHRQAADHRQQLHNTITAIHSEADGRAVITIKPAIHAIYDPVVLNVLRAFLQRSAAVPCFTCGAPVGLPVAVVTITALSLDPDAAIGGVVCQDCIDAGYEHVRSQTFDVLRSAGIKPNAENVHLTGGSA
jgi:hypothetical protein